MKNAYWSEEKQAWVKSEWSHEKNEWIEYRIPYDGTLPPGGLRGSGNMVSMSPNEMMSRIEILEKALDSEVNTRKTLFSASNEGGVGILHHTGYNIDCKTISLGSNLQSQIKYATIFSEDFKREVKNQLLESQTVDIANIVRTEAKKMARELVTMALDEIRAKYDFIPKEDA